MKPTLLLAMRPAPYVLLLLIAAAVLTAPFADTTEERLPKIAVSDNRVPRGRLHNGVLALDLEAREGIWYPEERDGPGLRVQAFAERDHPPEIPGPIIRVPEGMEILVNLRNAIPGATLVIHGVHTRPGKPDDIIQLAPGERREVRFRAGAPGTYYYWATTTGEVLPERI